MTSRSERGPVPVRAQGGEDAFLPRPGPRAVEAFDQPGGHDRVSSDLLFPRFEAEHSAGAADSRANASLAEDDLAEMKIRLRVAAARQEGLTAARGELSTRLMDERRRMDRLRIEFARDRQRFFAAAEGQVVRLALAIASRVLSREVLADPIPLAATVNTALSRVQEHSATTLTVPAAEVEAWQEILARGSAGKVTVLADVRMLPGDATLLTTVGRVECGVDVQLAEIARGFSELLQEQR